LVATWSSTKKIDKTINFAKVETQLVFEIREEFWTLMKESIANQLNGVSIQQSGST